MNITSSNSQYFLPGQVLASARAQVEQASTLQTKLTRQAGAEVAINQQALIKSGNTLHTDQIRGRLAENRAQNSAAKQAINEYLSVDDYERREELRVLGVDVYA